MKVCIIATETADGYIARNPNQLATTWTTRSDKRLFMRLTKQAGVAIMGWNTFQTIGKGLPGRRLIVLTPEKPQAVEGVEFTDEAPVELINRLESEGHNHVMICGGQMVYNQYIHSGLVNELYLTTQPVLFGQGMTLFKDTLDIKLELLDAQVEVTDGTIIAHYAVKSS